eukprot:2270630-Rhodomonas_salina.4
MHGTDSEKRMALPGSISMDFEEVPVEIRRSAISLRCCYAMPGTDIAYARWQVSSRRVTRVWLARIVNRQWCAALIYLDSIARIVREAAASALAHVCLPDDARAIQVECTCTASSSTASLETRIHSRVVCVMAGLLFVLNAACFALHGLNSGSDSSALAFHACHDD